MPDPDIDEQFEKFFKENHDLWTDEWRQNDYLIYYNYEDGEFQRSAPITSSTIPNPANFHPNYPEIVVTRLPESPDVWEDFSDEDIEYYKENPEQVLLDFPRIREEVVEPVRDFLERECRDDDFKDKFKNACKRI